MNSLMTFEKPFNCMIKRMNNMFNDRNCNLSMKDLPNVDIYEKDNKVYIEAELPGMNKEDIDIKLANGILTLSSKTRSENEVKEKEYFYKERSYGSFSRSFKVNKDLKPEDISAEYKDGILKIEFPKLDLVNNEAQKIDVK